MTRGEAFTFLISHQPMPEHARLTQDLMNTYDDIRKYFDKYPESTAIELFLRSFGDGDGWRVYQLIEGIFYKCARYDVVAALRIVLEDAGIPESVRYWSTQIAAAFADEGLRKGLNISLNSKNIDTLEAAALAIEILDTD